MATSWKLEIGGDQIAVLTLDVPEKKVNTLSRAALAELAGIVGQLEARSDVKGLLLKSGKPGQFIAGADLNELGALPFLPKEMLAKLAAQGHELFTRVSRLPFPTVALIDGPCLGGGTEMVLSLDERLISAGGKAQIGLPEVKIGLIPGWGGTQRLPRLIGVNAAVEVITGGEPLTPAKAAALGLVFDAVPADRLETEGRRVIAMTRDSGQWLENRKRREQPVGLSEDQQRFLFAAAEAVVGAKTMGQYPAPLVALKAINQGCNLPLPDALKVEQAAFLEVGSSPIAANLIAVFFMTNRLSRDTGVAANVAPLDVQRVGVLGAGLMGAGIATAHARAGIPTAMVDVDDKRIADGLARAQDVVMSRIKIGRAQPLDMAAMLAHLSTSTTHALFADRDVVIEAIVENEQAKTAVYRDLAKILRPDAILASNTSTISITRMAAAAPNAERFVGMHFFNPVDRMQLVEVIRGEKTSDETVATIVALAKRVKKTPIVVRDCAGFLVNRILFPYMTEAILLLLEGNGMDAIDKAATKFGMPMGPIALHDLVGLDTGLFAGTVTAAAYRDRYVPMPPLMQELVQAGRLGKKTGAGFRKFGGKKGKPEADPAFDAIAAKYRLPENKLGPEQLTDRLFLPMLLEATRCLEEQIVREPGDVDMGLILGLGFPAFRGGILRWCDTEGAGKIIERLGKYAAFGKRFEPTESLLACAKTGKPYYPPPNVAALMGGPK